MYFYLPLLFALLFNNADAQPSGQERHFSEAGSAVILMRSAFAHGYRHGYEEGYHLGNIDINMGRRPHTRLSQLHDLSSHYSAAFGPRKSFELGFQQGLRAGYMDGFAGRVFRGVENLRVIAVALDQNPPPADPSNIYFDRGVSAGYDQGLESVGKEGEQAEKVDISTVDCAQAHPLQRSQDSKDRARLPKGPRLASDSLDADTQGTFCDGYRRGFVLGHTDAVVLGPKLMVVAARK